MVYIFGWGVCFLMLAGMLRWPHMGRLLCVWAVLAMGSIAVFRGAVGTDTVAYELISAAVRDGGIEASSIERAFSALLAGLQFFSANDAVVIRLIAVLDVALLMLYIARSTENERYFLLAVFLPAFFYSYTMNALRIGLASFLFMLFCQSFARRKSVNASNGILGLSSVFMHYTACLFPLYFVAGFHRRIKGTTVVWLGGLILLSLGVAAVYSGYLIAKIRSYDALPAPSGLSGFADIILIGVLSLAVWKSTISSTAKYRLILLTWALAIPFMASVQFSYAGLRLLELVVFIFPLAFACALGVEHQGLNKQAKALLALFGVLSVIFVCRRFLVESPDSLAPFLPYHLISR